MYAEGLGCDIGSTMWVWIIDNLVAKRWLIKRTTIPVFFFFPKCPLYRGSGVGRS